MTGVVDRHWMEQNEWHRSAAEAEATRRRDEEIATAMVARGEKPQWCEQCGRLVGQCEH